MKKEMSLLRIMVAVFTKFDSKKKHGIDEKRSVIMLHHPTQPAKCPEGQATEGSAA